MRRTALITGADAGYASLLSGWLESIKMIKLDSEIDLCFLNLGCDQLQIENVKALGGICIEPDWDIDFPERYRMPDHFKAMVSRPFLKKYFPGYDYYMWIDADAWVQDPAVIGIYLQAAATGKIAIASQFDRSYKSAYKRQKLFGWTHNHKHYRLGWGWRVADKFGRLPILNSGVFALAGNSPHWELWGEALNAGLQRTRHKLVEQTALNLAIYRDHLPATYLPAYCNWLCDAALPKVDQESGMLVEPNAPYQPLGIVHLAGEFTRSAKVDLETVTGEKISSMLTYEQWQETRMNLMNCVPVE